MLSILKKLEIEIKEDIEQTQRLWDRNPSNDYYYAEISGLERSLARVQKEGSKQLNALDAWANETMRKEQENGCNKKSTGV